ncbi:MAG TPA: hypothetical protein PK598_10730 [Thermoanaerobaculia bacterium]|nr:hypothetical protein [Thermoanaerobaculia bacterium]
MSILTQTTSMPGSSFSLPARSTCPGSTLSPGSVCSSCYADQRRRYRWRAVKVAQERRLAWTLEALSSGRFVPTLVGLITARGEPHFRLHDSGDFFSPAYVDAWLDVARALPEVSFWAPTRSWAVGGRPRDDTDPLLLGLRRLAHLANVTVRPSALLVDDDPPTVPGLHAGSAVTTERARATCPKYLRSPPACGECRRCWAEPLKPVVYLKH